MDYSYDSTIDDLETIQDDLKAEQELNFEE